jgi:hypothetical protein
MFKVTLCCVLLLCQFITRAFGLNVNQLSCDITYYNVLKSSEDILFNCSTKNGLSIDSMRLKKHIKENSGGLRLRFEYDILKQIVSVRPKGPLTGQNTFKMLNLTYFRNIEPQSAYIEPEERSVPKEGIFWMKNIAPEGTRIHICINNK